MRTMTEQTAATTQVGVYSRDLLPASISSKHECAIWCYFAFKYIYARIWGAACDSPEEKNIYTEEPT